MALSEHELFNLWLDPPPVESMPQRAAELLAEGHETASLVRCASMFDSTHPADIRAVFETALIELGSTWTTRDEAVLHLIRGVAARLVQGEISPDEAATQVRPRYEFDDYIYNEPSAELSFWYECWISHSEPIPLDVERLRSVAAAVVEANR